MAPFNQVHGFLKNVTVIGNISIINLNGFDARKDFSETDDDQEAKVFLSRFLGFYMQIGGSIVSNCSSSLTYFINGFQIFIDNQHFPFGDEEHTIRFTNDFNSVFHKYDEIEISRFNSSIESLVYADTISPFYYLDRTLFTGFDNYNLFELTDRYYI